MAKTFFSSVVVCCEDVDDDDDCICGWKHVKALPLGALEANLEFKAANEVS
jgi:hypothetical protein